MSLLLLLTLASDPYDRPGHSMPWRRRRDARAAQRLRAYRCPSRPGMAPDIPSAPPTP